MTARLSTTNANTTKFAYCDQIDLMSSVALNSILIVESLEDEFHSGRALFEGLKALESDRLSVEYFSVNSAVCFQKLVNEFELRAKFDGIKPILHIEAHGIPSFGLQFANASELSWDELSNLITPLCSASELNLVVAASCCFGAEFLGSLAGEELAPAYAIVGPISSLFPDELLSGWRVFYQALIGTQLFHDAFIELKKQSQLKTEWLLVSADSWMKSIILNYVKTQCLKTDSLVRIERIQRQAALIGIHSNQKQIGRQFTNFSKPWLERRFASYLHCLEDSDNRLRFKKSIANLQYELRKMKHEGIYVL